jgi:hypothetical protein
MKGKNIRLNYNGTAWIRIQIRNTFFSADPDTYHFAEYAMPFSAEFTLNCTSMWAIF